MRFRKRRHGVGGHWVKTAGGSAARIPPHEQKAKATFQRKQSGADAREQRETGSHNGRRLVTTLCARDGRNQRVLTREAGGMARWVALSDDAKRRLMMDCYRYLDLVEREVEI
ncbi:MAG: hypothetical protein ABH835_01685 [Patescibacteria group bacterium]